MTSIPQKYIFILVLSFCFYASFARNSNPRISILTIEPGNEIYSIFGHTAIRVTSDTSDLVYNFGTFNFNDPAFYFKFIRGNLLYSLSVDNYRYFLENVRLESRTVHEQVLKLTDEQSTLLKNELERIYHSADRYYQYDFLRNNCATKVRDCISETGLDWIPELSGKSATYRQFLHPYIKGNYWLDFGINLLMGPEADQSSTPSESMFLPEFIYGALIYSDVAWPDEVIPAMESIAPKKGLWFTPLLIMLGIIILTLISKTRKLIFYGFLSVVGITGLIILMIDLISVHPIYSQNFNILWTAPAILPVLFLRKKAFIWVTGIYMALVSFSLVFGWMLKQEISITFIPWMISLLFVLFINLNLHHKIRHIIN